MAQSQPQRTQRIAKWDATTISWNAIEDEIYIGGDFTTPSAVGRIEKTNFCTCLYCKAKNKETAPVCIQCGAPMGE